MDFLKFQFWKKIEPIDIGPFIPDMLPFLGNSNKVLNNWDKFGWNSMVLSHRPTVSLVNLHLLNEFLEFNKSFYLEKTSQGSIVHYGTLHIGYQLVPMVPTGRNSLQMDTNPFPMKLNVALNTRLVFQNSHQWELGLFMGYTTQSSTYTLHCCGGQ